MQGSAEKLKKEISDMSKLCCICQYPIENDDAPVIAMSGYGNPKCVCEECEGLIETATRSHEPEEITEACKAIGEALTKGNTGDEQVIDAVNDILYSANERCTAIKEGTYDFALDDEASENEFEITDDLKESEEDRKQDERDEKIVKIIDTVTSWAAGIILTAAVVFFVLKFIL